MTGLLVEWAGTDVNPLNLVKVDDTKLQLAQSDRFNVGSLSTYKISIQTVFGRMKISFYVQVCYFSQ